jgi:hypothetical protein
MGACLIVRKSKPESLAVQLVPVATRGNTVESTSNERLLVSRRLKIIMMRSKTDRVGPQANK